MSQPRWPWRLVASRSRNSRVDLVAVAWVQVVRVPWVRAVLAWARVVRVPWLRAVLAWARVVQVWARLLRVPWVRMVRARTVPLWRAAPGMVTAGIMVLAGRAPGHCTEDLS